MTNLSRTQPKQAEKTAGWRFPWPQSFAGLMVYMLLLALITGFGSAYWMIRDPISLGRERAGAWVYWPDIGSANIDPYNLATINRHARLPLSVSEGLELAAAHDTAGAPLNSSCTYRLGPTVPQARFWTLTVFNARDGRPIRTDLGRAGFTSSEIVRNEDGTFSISLSRQAQSGNWLQLPDQSNFTVVLRLYDVPASGDRTVVNPQLVPRIERVECAS